MIVKFSEKIKCLFKISICGMIVFIIDTPRFSADILSTEGHIGFDIDSDEITEAKLNSLGLAIG